MQATAQLLLAASVLPTTLAWGNLGHETIAYVASYFVTSVTETYFQKVLKDTSSSYLANVSTWADTYKYTSAGLFSKPYHFIDAQDNPPSTCNVDYDRDCGSTGCIVSAIKNYTSIIQESSSTATSIHDATKFIVHFVGDIHQPLHDENLDYGGNDIVVKYGSTSTNLHHIWDTNMPEQYAGGYTLADAEAWAKTLTTSIKSGMYKSETSSWLSGIDINDAETTSMGWVSDSNAYVCSTVIPNGVSALQGVDLSTTYYKNALPVIELQFAKAGYRRVAS